MSNRAVSSGDRSGHGQNTKREDEQPGIGPGPAAQTRGTRGRCTTHHFTGCGAGRERVTPRPEGRGAVQERLAGVPGNRIPTRAVPLRPAAYIVGGTGGERISPEIPLHHPETSRHRRHGFIPRGNRFPRRTDHDRAPGDSAPHGCASRDPGTSGRRRRGRTAAWNTDGRDPGLCLVIHTPFPLAAHVAPREERGNRPGRGRQTGRRPGCGCRGNETGSDPVARGTAGTSR